MTLKNSDLKKQALVSVTAPNGDVKRVLMPHETSIGRPEQKVAVAVNGVLSVTDGITGSLTRLIDGSSYLAAGTNVTITSGSGGQVVIAAPGAGGAPTDATYVTITPNAGLSDERVLSAGANITITTSSTGVTISSTGGSGGGADEAAQYVVMVATASLPNERVLTAGSGLARTDGGAGGAVTLAVDGTVARVSGTIFTGPVSGPSATFTSLTGSLSFLSGGVSFIAAGQNASVNTASNGQVIIRGPLGWCAQSVIQAVTASGGWEVIGAFYLETVPNSVSVEAILLVSSASLSGSVRLYNVTGAGPVTGSALGTASTTDTRLVTGDIAGQLTGNRLFQIEAECFGGDQLSHFTTVRSVIVRGKL